MNLKNRYVAKYLAFRALPFFGTICIMIVALIWVTALYNTVSELIFVIVISAVTVICHLTYYAYHIISFSGMIKRQEHQYRTVFDDRGAKNISIFSIWLICSDHWLIVPGKLAIFRGEIKSVSMGEAENHGRRGTAYPVRIKTRSGRAFKLLLGDQEHARAVRKWAR